MRPAHQRLEADDSTVFGLIVFGAMASGVASLGVEQRLVGDLQPPVADRLTQVALHLALLPLRRLHLRREEAEAAAAERLGLVQGQVGAVDQPLRSALPIALQGDPDAGADVDPAAAQIVRLGQAGDQAAGQLRRRRRLHGAGLHDDELVAPRARRVAHADRAAPQALRNLLQQQVAGTMAVAVIDLLEAVEVDEQHRQGMAGALRRGQRPGQAVMQHGPVRQAGQRVVVRQEADLLLGRQARADVAQRRHPGGAAGIGDRPGPHLHRQVGAIPGGDGGLAGIRPRGQRDGEVRYPPPPHVLQRQPGHRAERGVGVQHGAVPVDQQALERAVGQLAHAAQGAGQLRLVHALPPGLGLVQRLGAGDAAGDGGLHGRQGAQQVRRLAPALRGDGVVQLAARNGAGDADAAPQ